MPITAVVEQNAQIISQDEAAPATQPARHSDVHTPRQTYIPGLDGLRALAVIAVLLYHADLPWAPGGFLGVDVFFVLSGYLITTLLRSEWEARGQVSLGAFWGRRARRLLPALALLLVAVLAFASLFLHGEVAGWRGDILAALGYAMNWYLIYGHKSYFEAVGRLSPLQHLWSLAVEEQFYLVWPLLFVAGMRVLRRWGMLLATLAGAAASTALMVAWYNPAADPSRLYYGTDTRATALLLGAALALIVSTGHRVPGTRFPAWVLDTIGLAALICLIVCMVRLGAYGPFLYRGGFALVALAAVAVIAAVAHPHTLMLPALLRGRVLRWVGVRSYGIYLWHWPVFVVTRPHLDVPLDGTPLLLLRFALTVGLATLSYRFIEAPVRNGALLRAWQAMREVNGPRRRQLRARWALSAGTLAALITTLGVTVTEARPAPIPTYLAVTSVHSTSFPRRTTVASVADRALTALPAFTPTPAIVAVIPTVTTPIVTLTATMSIATETVAATATAVASPTAATAALMPTTLPTTAPTRVEMATPSPAPSSVGPVPSSHRVMAATSTAIPTPSALPAAPVIAPTAVPAMTPATPIPTSPPPTATIPATATVPATATAPTPTLVPATPEPPPAETLPAVAPPALHVFAIGDSVMVGAAGALQDALGDVEVDAAVSRQASTAIEILRAKRDADQLGDVVVVHMGTNGTFSAPEFDAMMAILADVPRVVFVNLKVPRPWEAADNAVIADGVQRYPNTVLVDWHTAGNNHPEYFWGDGIHLQPNGAQAYANLIAAALTP